MSHALQQEDLIDLIEARNMLQARLLGRLFSSSFNRHLKLAVKGGMAMRVAHGVARNTKDIDLDADFDTSLQGLRNHVRRSIQSSLVDAGLTGLTVSEPKQTQTTARWKIFGSLPNHEHIPFSLTVEVSMRENIDDNLVREVPMELDGKQVFVPVWVDEKLYMNKVCALLSSVRDAPRDVLDLDVLVRADVGIDAPALRARLLEDNPHAKSWDSDDWVKWLWDKLEAFDEDRFNTEIAAQWTDNPHPTWDDWQDLLLRVGTQLEGVLRQAFPTSGQAHCQEDPDILPACREVVL